MHELNRRLSTLRRPRLLVRAAQFGLAEYRRERDLKRLLGMVAAPERVLVRLLDEEARLNEIRQAGTADYDLRRHLELIIAVLAEARALPAPEPVPLRVPVTVPAPG